MRRFLFALLIAGCGLAAAQATGEIYGTVKDSGGPMPGATVTVTGPTLPQPRSVVVSSPFGSYRITGLPPGTYTAVYSSPWFPEVRESVEIRRGARVEKNVTLPPCTSCEVIIDYVQAIAPPGEIYGFVRDTNGSVLPGVTVTASPASGGQARQAVTNSAGRFLIDQVLPATYAVRFTLPGFVPSVRDDVRVGLGQQVAVLATLAAGPIDQNSDAALFKPGEVAVSVETPFGSIWLAIDTKAAPITAANFLKYVDGKFYDGGRFHRATRPDNYTPVLPNRPPMEIIQGGINSARRAEGFPAIPLERTSITGLTHKIGTVSMARGTAADTATSDFFICLDHQPSLDFGGKRFDDEQGAAAFGRVVKGLDVVREIQQQPVNGQSLNPPVTIVRISRLLFL